MTTRIKLLQSELLYDIRNIAYVEGHLIDDGTTAAQHRSHLVTDIGEEGNIDIVSRALRLAFSELQWALARAGLSPAPCYSDRLTLPKVFTLRLSTSMPHAGALLLTQLSHHFMIASALFHWLSLTHSEAAPKWRTRADEYAGRITSLTLHTGGVTTRRSHPF